MWEISNYNQTISFLLSLCIGGIFCALYDIVRASRKVCSNSFWSVLFSDIIIWTVYAFVTFIFLMSRTNGEIRGYVLFGEFFGFVLFRISLSRLLFPMLSFVFINVSRICQRIADYIGKFYAKFEVLLLKIWEGTHKIFKSAKKLLKNAFKLLYTNKNIADLENALDETKTKA